MATKSITIKFICQTSCLVIFLWLPLSFYSAIGQQPIVFTDSNSVVSLTKQLEVFIDDNASLSANQILQQYNSKQFDKKLEDINVYSKAAIWLYVSIKNKTIDDLILELSPGILNNVLVYTVKEGAIIDSLAIGNVAPVEGKKIISRKIAFLVKSNQNNYLIKVQSNTFLPFSVELYSKKSFFQKEHILNVINGILFGTLVLSLLYNLLLYLSVRDSAYLYFSIYVFFAAIIMAYNFGVFNFLSVSPVISLYITVFYGIFLIATILFVISFLEFNNLKAYKNMKVIITLIIIICFVDLLNFHFFANISLFLLSGIIYPYIFVVVKEGKNGNKSARLFSIPWFIMTLAYVFFALHRIIPNSLINLDFNFIVYSGYFSLVLLSLAVGNKLNIYHKEQELARAKELSALQDNEVIMSMQKIELEKIVQERNKELIDKNRSLSSQQYEIEAQTHEINLKNKEINQINKNLQIKNKQIEEQNISLEQNRKELEAIVETRTKELKMAEKKAIVADTLKTTFLNNLSREIKIPMNAITGYAGLLINKTISTAQRDEYLRVIINSVHTLLSLIDDIVTLSRIQAGIMKAKFRHFNLNSFIELIADEFNEKLTDSKNKDVKIVTKIDDRLKNLNIDHDYNKLWLIFRHLIENAIKFTEKGTIEIGFSILDFNQMKSKSDSFEERRVQILFFVKDSGSGISDEDIEKYLLKRDTNIDNKQFKQKGIGLAIIVGLVDLLKGEIEVRNTKGTEFYIKLKAELINT